MKCQNCGQKLTGNETFCAFCGSPVAQQAPQQQISQQNQYGQGNVNPQYKTTQYPQYENQPGYGNQQYGNFFIVN